jgi:hypothetical protein
LNPKKKMISRFSWTRELWNRIFGPGIPGSSRYQTPKKSCDVHQRALGACRLRPISPKDEGHFLTRRPRGKKPGSNWLPVLSGIYWWFLKLEYPPNHGFQYLNGLILDDLGYHHFRKPSLCVCINIYISQLRTVAYIYH